MALTRVRGAAPQAGTLAGLLQSTVQRLPRYGLLLRGILKHMSKVATLAGISGVGGSDDARLASDACARLKDATKLIKPVLQTRRRKFHSRERLASRTIEQC